MKLREFLSTIGAKDIAHVGDILGNWTENYTADELIKLLPEDYLDVDVQVVGNRILVRHLGVWLPEFEIL